MESLNKRIRLLQKVFEYGVLVSTALMIWKTLKIVTNCDSPIIVVKSAMMEPAFLKRGDLIFLTNFDQDPNHIGDIMVMNIESRNIPIIHRVVRLHERSGFFWNRTIKFLTRGDDNLVDDRDLYPIGMHWLTRKDIIGKVRGILPGIGMTVIYINDVLGF